MPTGGGKKRTAAGPRKPKATRGPRPVLGNDPFERGAAVRPPVAAPPRATAAPPTEPASPPPPPPPVAPPVASPPPVPPVSTPQPASAPFVERAAPAVQAADARLEALAARAEERLGSIAARAEQGASAVGARLRQLAAEEASGAHARELAAVVARLWPALRGRLGALASLRHLWSGGPRDAHGLDAELVARVAPALDLLVDVWWRVSARGLEKLPAGGGIVVANHGGRFHWDALVLGHLARRAGRALRPLLDEPALATPVAGPVARRLGAVAASPESALALLGEGKLVAVFPEGSRNGERPWPERYRIRRFGRGGFARIALEAGVPVIPCSIVGSEETSAPFARPGWLAEALGLPLLAAAPTLPLGPLSWLPLPSRWSIRVGDPIVPEPGSAAEDVGAVNLLAERTRDTLQRMLDEDVASRRSVYL